MPWQLKDVILRMNVKTHNTTLEKQQITINCVIVAQSYARRYCSSPKSFCQELYFLNTLAHIV